MSPFDALLIGHLMGDFLFQTTWMAVNKTRKWLALMIHCAVYTAIVIGVSWLLSAEVSWRGYLFIFLFHLVLDRRGFVRLWAKWVTKAEGPDAVWLNIVADQVFHVLGLVVALYI